MKDTEPEEKPNHERWIISYADFTTLLLATFVVMYAVSTVNSSKFQEMAESFSTAFMGRTLNVTDTGFGAANKGPFHFMPNPVEVPIVTREIMIRNAPPALREEETEGVPNENQPGQFLPRGGSQEPVPQPPSQQSQSQQSQSQQQAVQSGSQSSYQLQQQSRSLASQDASAKSIKDQVTQRIQNLDAAFEQLTKSLAELIRKGEVNVTLQPLGVVIDINEVLLFHSGKADLTPEALPLIDQISKILAGLHYQIQVNGFTDNVPIHNPQFDSNWDLSATRAISVVKRFVASGIDPTLMVGAGFGEYHPIAPNTTADGKAANRRVSIVVVSPVEGNDPARSRLLGSGSERPAKPATPSTTAPPPALVPPPPPSASLPTAAPTTPPAPTMPLAPLAPDAAAVAIKPAASPPSAATPSVAAPAGPLSVAPSSAVTPSEVGPAASPSAAVPAR
jgi:flagellar motor protein MotB